MQEIHHITRLGSFKRFRCLPPPLDSDAEVTDSEDVSPSDAAVVVGIASEDDSEGFSVDTIVVAGESVSLAPSEDVSVLADSVEASGCDDVPSGAFSVLDEVESSVVELDSVVLSLESVPSEAASVEASVADWVASSVEGFSVDASVEVSEEEVSGDEAPVLLSLDVGLSVIASVGLCESAI